MTKKRKYRCKCFVTKEVGTTDVFIKKPVGKTFKYFKSEEVYNEFINKREQKKRTMQYIYDILGYKTEKILPPFLIKQVNDLANIYGYEVVYETFKENTQNIQYWLNQENKFNSEVGKIQYMMAIIKNNINDVDKRWQREQKRKQQNNENKIDIDIDMLDLKFTNKKSDDGIADFL